MGLSNLKTIQIWRLQFGRTVFKHISKLRHLEIKSDDTDAVMI